VFTNDSQGEAISYYSGYTEDEIEPVFELMVDYLVRPVIHEALYKKYASKKFMKGEYSMLLYDQVTSTNVCSFSHYP
jgi:hypothetical protein